MPEDSPLRRAVKQDVAVAAARRLAPSDFAFLWDECKRCFYLKVAMGHERPKMPMPSIFTAIDGSMKDFFMGQRTEAVAPALPPGEFKYAGKWVESAMVRPAGASRALYVRGPFDTVIAFDDGSHAIIDFKTSSQKPENVAKYARQLHAYAYALEHPAGEATFALPRVETMGLLVYEPGRFKALGGAARLGGTLAWIEIPKDEAAFLAFLDEVARVLEAPAPPPASETCSWCRFRAASRTHGH